MPLPSEFLPNGREAALADAVWRLADTLPKRWTLHSTHEILNNADWPWMNKKIIWARDWITAQREDDGVGGIVYVNRELHSNYTADEIGDVEHFFVAALLGTIGGPAGGILLNELADTTWEMVVGPARIAWSTRSKKAVYKNIKFNWKQLSGPDAAGAVFGSLFSSFQLYEALKGGR